MHEAGRTQATADDRNEKDTVISPLHKESRDVGYCFRLGFVGVMLGPIEIT